MLSFQTDVDEEYDELDADGADDSDEGGVVWFNGKRTEIYAAIFAI